ncbi:MAG: hypothetical protein HY711_09055 [Candidatus Melainabacteria bacterium]|nr:hypothetical protein [Candidatus Melainabacteria bacterium]
MRRSFVVGLMLGITIAVMALPAQAQRVKTDALEKTKFYNSPRQFQIIDDRPIIRDFREAPQQAGSIEIPPGPMGAGGAGGSGGGAYGGPGSSLPAGGLQLGGPNQGFRSAPEGLGSLPKSGFGGPSNIPARGMGPRGALPGAQSTNQLMGKMLNQGKGVGAGAPRGMSPSAGRSVGNYSAPAVQSYGGGYGSGSGSASGGSASRTESNVRGRLLNAK